MQFRFDYMKNLLIVFCTTVISTVLSAQTTPPVASKVPPGVAGFVKESDFMANPAAYNGKTITIANVTFRPRKVSSKECLLKVPSRNKDIGIEFASNPTWQGVCFNMYEPDHTILYNNHTKLTKADITIKGSVDKGFSIVKWTMK
jgi:hypothetical protein